MTNTALTSVDNLLLDPQWYAESDWHATLRMLRQEDPVHWTGDTRYGHPYWAVTSFGAIRDVFDRFDAFSSRMGTVPPRSGRRWTPEERWSMALDARAPYLDPPLHGLYRRPINKHFAVPVIKKMTTEIDRIVEDLIADVAEKGEFDLVTDVAAQLPMRVILGLLGVPREDWTQLELAASRYAMSSDPAYTIDDDPLLTARTGRKEVDDYAESLAVQRREHPEDDLASVIGSLKIDGDFLSVHEMKSWFGTLIVGGLESTRNGIGAGILAFMDNPEQRAMVVGNEAVVPDAVEEVLRWGSPSRVILRTVNDDMEFHGKELRAGDWVMLYLASGNRDAAVWQDPDTFDITRERKDHLALGHGIHKCLGRNLLRLEMARFFPRFLRAFPKLSLTGEAQRTADYNANGFQRLPVTHGGVVYR